MARFNLRFAARTVRDMADVDGEVYRQMVDRLALEPGEPEAWERAAEAMHIPFSPGLGIHPQDHVFLEREIWDLENTPPDKRPLLLHFHPLVIYRYQVLKQADVVLALFLQGNHFSDEDKLADFEYYDPLTTGDSTLSAVVQAILAAEVGYQDLALEYFRESIFVDLGDLHHNAADGVHVASAGGVWTALVSGFGGMRDHFGELSFDPRLPADVAVARVRAALARHAPGRHRHARRAARARDRGRARRLQRARRRLRRRRGRGGRRAASTDRGPSSPAARRCASSATSAARTASLLSASVPTVTSTIPIIVGAADVEHGADA